MSTRARPVESLKPADFFKHPVWEFVLNDQPDETSVVPVERLPIDSLDGRIVGSEVELASGTRVWALLGNVDVHDARRTRHFLTVSVFTQDEWFHLARYHDVDREERGPHRLSKALGLRIEDVFPILYDIQPWVTGAADSVVGSVEAEPLDRLSRAELIKLAVPRRCDSQPNLRLEPTRGPTVAESERSSRRGSIAVVRPTRGKNRPLF